MKRLTNEHTRLGFSDSSKLPSYVSIYERLREYENIGLTLTGCKKILSLDLAVKNYELQQENTKLKTRLEKSVELPCKIGDILYKKDFFGNKIREYKVIAISVFNSISIKSRIDITAHNYRGASVPIDGDCVGKTVFLTKEEAERALKEREENET